MHHMELKKIISDTDNIKYFDVCICDAYLSQNMVYIPEHETTEEPFYDAVLNGSPKSFIILTAKN